MIDIHAHVLPGIDDGPRTRGEALETIRALADGGVTGIVATPHFNQRYPRISASEVQHRVEAMQAIVDRIGMDVKLWAGHEIRLDADVQDMLERGMSCTINHGPYLLLELPTTVFPLSLPTILGTLRLRGYIPVIAHAERYRPTRQDPSVIVPMIEAGAVIQVTISSLSGGFGSDVRRCAEVLLGRNLVHVLASDAHALQDRQPQLPEGLAAARLLVGEDRVREMTEVIPHRIVQGLPVTIPTIADDAAHTSTSLFGRKRN